MKISTKIIDEKAYIIPYIKYAKCYSYHRRIELIVIFD